MFRKLYSNIRKVFAVVVIAASWSSAGAMGADMTSIETLKTASLDQAGMYQLAALELSAVHQASVPGDLVSTAGSPAVAVSPVSGVVVDPVDSNAFSSRLLLLLLASTVLGFSVVARR